MLFAMLVKCFELENDHIQTFELGVQVPASRRLKRMQGKIQCMSYTSDCRRLAVVLSDDHIHVMDAETLNVEQDLYYGKLEALPSILFQWPLH